MMEIMYEIPSDPSIESVTITADCVENGSQPQIVHESDAAAAGTGREAAVSELKFRDVTA